MQARPVFANHLASLHEKGNLPANGHPFRLNRHKPVGSCDLLDPLLADSVCVHGVISLIETV